MDSYRHRYSVAKMASRLGVSVSSYYDYRSGKHMVRVVKKAVLGATIKHHFYACKELYGSTRLSVELKANGTSVSRVTVSKYMKELGLRSKFYRKFRNTTDSKHDNPVAENLLDRQFVVNEPNKYWVSDITYISVVGGFEYLTTIIDLFDRKVVGYSQSKTLKAKDTVIEAFNMAMRRRIGAPRRAIHLQGVYNSAD